MYIYTHTLTHIPTQTHRRTHTNTNDLAEDNVLAIEPRGGNSCDEKLRPVGVGTGIGHRKLHVHVCVGVCESINIREAIESCTCV